MAEGGFPDGAALIVGGSGGIGRAVAKCFAEAGCDIAVTYRRKADVAAEGAAEAEQNKLFHLNAERIYRV